MIFIAVKFPENLQKILGNGRVAYELSLGGFSVKIIVQYVNISKS